MKTRRNHSLQPWILATAGCLLTAPLAQAQTITATINGVVTDASGAVLPNATVVAKNVNTGVQTTATANESGEYSLRFLQIGKYTVSVTQNGFKTFVSRLSRWK